MTWQNSVCMSIGKTVFPDVNNVVKAVPSVKNSAIDNFYEATNKPLTQLSPDFFTAHGDDIAGLLLVGLISATENYFRDILGFSLKTCPCSMAHASDEKVQLGSLLWAPDGLHGRPAFEFMAFSNGANIRTTVQKFLNYQVRAAGTWSAMLIEYDKLCEVRHAIVHSGNMLAGKNALKLGLRPSTDNLRVRFDYPTLQDAGKVCTSLVQAANNELFELMIGRWAEEWRKLESWEPSTSARLFSTVRQAFLSKRDQTNKSISNARSTAILKKQVEIAFNL